MVRQMESRKYYWVQYIKQRIRNHKNFLFIISGPTGSGKSWTGLSIGKEVDKDFNVGRVIFKGKDLMLLINSDALKNKKGVYLMWDEAGIDLSNRSWQSLANKMINFLMQTFRHRCFVLCFTAPYSDFIDKATRKLFHAEFKTVSIDYHKRKVKIKPQLIQYNSRMGKFYYKYLRISTKKGVVPIVEWNVPAPSKELIKEYENKKELFTSELNREIEAQLNKDELKKQKKPLTELQERISECKKKGIIKHQAIADILNKKREQITLNIGYMKRKGYI